MILYLNSGIRKYGRKPVPVYRREGWEFQLIRGGACALLCERGGSRRAGRGTLWVFPPSVPHGWGGADPDECEIRVVHFSHVPEPLRTHGMKTGHITAALDEDEMERVDSCFDSARATLQEPTFLSALWAERLLLELTVLALKSLPREQFGAFHPSPSGVVAAAITFFREHMHEGVSVEATAHAVYRSPGHLRRLFREVLGLPPQKVFMKERLHRAEELVLYTRDTLETVAEACGFDSAGSLVRAFRSAYGISPGAWRRSKREETRKRIGPAVQAGPQSVSGAMNGESRGDRR